MKLQNLPKILSASIALAGTALLPLSLNAQTIVNDTFSDASPNNSVDQSTDGDSLDIPWFAIRSGNDVTTGTDAVLDPTAPNLVLNRTPGGSGRPIVGTLYSTTNAAATSTFTSEAAASSATVGGSFSSSIGAKLTLSLDLRFTASTTGGTFQFGLFNSNGTLFIDDTASTTNDDFGYYVTVQRDNATPSNPSITKDLGTGSTSGDNGGMFLGNTGALTSTSGSPISINDLNPHNLRLELTRTTEGASGNVQLDFFLDGVLYASATDSSGTPFTTFDQIAISSGNYTYRIDDVVLTSVIPEPSTMGMVAAGFGMLISLQRFRRRK
jgi:hypothetical protein